MKPEPCDSLLAFHDDLPVFSGPEQLRLLTRCWGIPNSAPRPGESPFGRNRVLFVDDFDNGRPIAYWIPGPTEPWKWADLMMQSPRSRAA